MITTALNPRQVTRRFDPGELEALFRSTRSDEQRQTERAPLPSSERERAESKPPSDVRYDCGS